MRKYRDLLPGLLAAAPFVFPIADPAHAAEDALEPVIVRAVAADQCASLDVIDVFNRAASDIEYFYCSRLPGEAPGVCRDGSAGIDDVRLHPVLPRTVRATL